LYLFTIGIFFARNRSFLYRICSHFGYTEKWRLPEPVIPEVELSRIVPENSALQVREPIPEYASVLVLELVVINKLIKVHNPGKLFEIGTFDGRTALNMACNSSAGATVYTLDLPKDELDHTKLPLDPRDKKPIDKEVSGSRYLETDCEKKIVQLYGDSATFDFSPFFNAVDFVFIDGSHSYEYVLNDSRQALKLLKNGKGVILWHDYGTFWKGVKKALDELYLGSDEFKGLRQIEGTSLVCLIIK
jgi:SAM-dependent methyltransferase